MDQDEFVTELAKLDLSACLSDKAFAAKFISSVHEELQPLIPKFAVRIFYYAVLLPIAKEGDKIIDNVQSKTASSILNVIPRITAFSKLLNIIKRIDAPSSDRQKYIAPTHFDYNSELIELGDYLEKPEGPGQNYGEILTYLQEIYNQRLSSDFLYIPKKVEDGEFRNRNLSALQFQSTPIDLLGRDEEIRQLEEFLQGDSLFSWMVITGQAGAGKSRIALELIKNNAIDWHKGFYFSSDTPAQFNNWIPMAPTLVIFDNALNNIDAIRSFLGRCAVLQNNGKLYFQIKVILLERNFPEISDRISNSPLWSAIFNPQNKVINEQISNVRKNNLNIPPLNIELSEKIIKEIAGSNSNKNIAIPEELSKALSENEDLSLPLFLLLAGQYLAEHQADNHQAGWNIQNLIDHASMTDLYVSGDSEGIYIATLIAKGTIWGPTPTEISLSKITCASPIKARAAAYTHTGSDNFIFKPDILGEFFCYEFLKFLKTRDQSMDQNILQELFVHEKYGQRDHWSMTLHVKSFFSRLGNDIAKELRDEWNIYFELIKDIYTVINNKIPKFYQRSFLAQSLDSIVLGGNFSQRAWFVDKCVRLSGDQHTNEDIWYNLARHALSMDANDTVIEIIKRKDECNLTQDHLNALILDSAQAGSVEIIELLIGQGVDINVKTQAGVTLLHLAAGNGKMDAVKFILEQL